MSSRRSEAPGDAVVSTLASSDPPSEPELDDHRLAAVLAEVAGAALVDERDRTGADHNPWALRDRGDQLAHDLLVERLSKQRPSDIVMSEEGAEDARRLDAERCWILDPLDGTYDYPYADSIEWAVHVAVVTNQRPTAAAVAVPGLGEVFATDRPHGPADRQGRTGPLVVSGRSASYGAAAVAEELGGAMTACGSSGVKAMLVVTGVVDVYVHSSGLWEWDVCAPAAVAAANGLIVTDIDGDEILYNKSRPIVRGLVIARPEYAEATRAAIAALI